MISAPIVMIAVLDTAALSKWLAAVVELAPLVQPVNVEPVIPV